MSDLIIKKITKSIKDTIFIPGDKSISHRAIMVGAIADGTTRIKNCLICDDTYRTVNAFKVLGVGISLSKYQGVNVPGEVIVRGVGLHGLKPPKCQIYLGNSGTSMRLLAGILSGQGFKCRLNGDKSLLLRPMKRIIEPLTMMGAKISGSKKETGEIYPPLTIHGRRLKSINYRLPIPSAQVKSALLFAGLYANGITQLIESVKTRDHTERILKLFGADLLIKGNKVRIKQASRLGIPSNLHLNIPGDISSAAFFSVAAAAIPGSRLTLMNVGINPTRTGIIEVLRRMGANIDISICSSVNMTNWEPVGNITVEHKQLRGITIKPLLTPRLIDELPVIIVAACFAEGKTIIEGAAELRVKETDRIKSMVTGLTALGARIDIIKDSLSIEGGCPLRGSVVRSFGDHRTAMSLAIAGLMAKGETIIRGSECIDKSFPDFVDMLKMVK